MTTTFDPRTGVFSRPMTEDELDVLHSWARSELAADPCTCPLVAGPHTHAPHAYPVWDADLRANVWCGG